MLRFSPDTPIHAFSAVLTAQTMMFPVTPFIASPLPYFTFSPVAETSVSARAPSTMFAAAPAVSAPLLGPAPGSKESATPRKRKREQQPQDPETPPKVHHARPPQPPQQAAMYHWSPIDIRRMYVAPSAVPFNAPYGPIVVERAQKGEFMRPNEYDIEGFAKSQPGFEHTPVKQEEGGIQQPQLEPLGRLAALMSPRSISSFQMSAKMELQVAEMLQNAQKIALEPGQLHPSVKPASKRRGRKPRVKATERKSTEISASAAPISAPIPVVVKEESPAPSGTPLGSPTASHSDWSDSEFETPRKKRRSPNAEPTNWIDNVLKRADLQMPLKVGDDYQCPVCRALFRLRKHCRRHMIMHTDEKPFSCEICCKGFTRQDSYKRHRLKCNHDAPGMRGRRKPVFSNAFEGSVLGAGVFEGGVLDGGLANSAREDTAPESSARESAPEAS